MQSKRRTRHRAYTDRNLTLSHTWQTKETYMGGGGELVIVGGWGGEVVVSVIGEGVVYA